MAFDNSNGASSEKNKPIFHIQSFSVRVTGISCKGEAMRFCWYQSPRTFLDALASGAGGDIVNYSLIAGCAEGVLKCAATSPFGLLLLTIEDDGNFLGAAFMKPPRKLLLICPADLAPDVAREIHALGGPIPAVMVNEDAAQAFLDTWSALTGHPYRPGISEGLHVLRDIRPVNFSPVRMRLARPEDTELLVKWQVEFQREALPDEAMSEEAIRTLIAEGIESKTRYLWENGEAVSMVLLLRHVLDARWISGVYTPPAHRRRGYATSCVARISEQCLADGASYCFLFTDLANPTSNAIYRRIG